VGDRLPEESGDMRVEPRNIAGSDSVMMAGVRRGGTHQGMGLAISQHRWGAIDPGSIDMPSHWSVPWSDLMMVMMVMFAVMYAAKLPEQDAAVIRKEQAPVSAQLPPRLEEPKVEKSDRAEVSAEEIFRLSEKLIQDAHLGNIDVVLTENDAIKVSVHGNLFFDLGMAELKPEAVSFLDQLSEILAANRYKVEVSGHTDDFPINNAQYPTNWELSTARAAKVARYLIQHAALVPGRFTVLGHASYQPTLPNTTPANKARNRRVEIIITRDEYKP
jgi:chemotaxis protein MotB